MLKKLRYLKYYLSSGKKISNIYSSQLLHPILHGETFLPISSSSLSLHTLHLIINDIIINKKYKIVEFGSGISTIIIARLAKKNNLPIKIISIDHEQGWLSHLKAILQKEELADYVEFIHAPLTNMIEEPFHTNWYEVPKESEINFEGTQLVLIDGPYAHEKKNRYSRYGAVPFIKPFLAQQHTIVLDDTNRKGERTILKLWEKQFDLKFKHLSDTSSFHMQGDYWNFEV